MDEAGFPSCVTTTRTRMSTAYPIEISGRDFQVSESNYRVRVVSDFLFFFFFRPLRVRRTRRFASTDIRNYSTRSFHHAHAIKTGFRNFRATGLVVSEHRKTRFPTSSHVVPRPPPPPPNAVRSSVAAGLVAPRRRNRERVVN